MLTSRLRLTLVMVWGCLCALPPTTAAQESAHRVKPIGSFSNVTSDGEHESGYSVKLWSRGPEILGFVSYHAGLIGDAPTGVLTHVQFTRSTGDLKFSAKLSTGFHSCRLHDNLPSRILISFRGRLHGRQLRGTFTLEDHLHAPPLLDARDTVVLRDDRTWTPYMEEYESVEAWQRDHARMLQRLGPKW